MLGSDATPMPVGAQIVQQAEKVLTTHLWFNMSGKPDGSTSLEALSAQGGTIETLGGYRYIVTGLDGTACVEYNGALFSASCWPQARPKNRCRPHITVSRLTSSFRSNRRSASRIDGERPGVCW
jgi:hypothetical protein